MGLNLAVATCCDPRQVILLLLASLQPLQEYKWVPVRAEMVIVNDLAAVRRNIVIIIVVIVVIIIIKYQPKCGTYQDMARGVFDEMVE